MLTLVTLDLSLTKVGDSALALTRAFSDARAKELRTALEMLAWMLAQDVSQVKTPLQKEALRHLRIETTTLLSEIDSAACQPTAANHNAVIHRAKAWNQLLARARPILGIPGTAVRLRVPGPGLKRPRPLVPLAELATGMRAAMQTADPAPRLHPAAPTKSSTNHRPNN